MDGNTGNLAPHMSQPTAQPLYMHRNWHSLCVYIAPAQLLISDYQPVQPRQEAHLYIRQNNQDLIPASVNNLIRMTYANYGADYTAPE